MVRAQARSRPLNPRTNRSKSIVLRSFKKATVIGMFVLAVGLLATPVLMLGVGNAQDARVAKSMAALKDQTTKLGAPKIDGNDAVGGRDAPALYFGSTKMNNNFSVVDAVAEEGGRGTAATLFVKSGDDYVRVATNVSTRIGSGRGLGTTNRPERPSRRSKRAIHTTARRRFLDALYQLPATFTKLPNLLKRAFMMHRTR